MTSVVHTQTIYSQCNLQAFRRPIIARGHTTQQVFHVGEAWRNSPVQLVSRFVMKRENNQKPRTKTQCVDRDQNKTQFHRKAYCWLRKRDLGVLAVVVYLASTTNISSLPWTWCVTNTTHEWATTAFTNLNKDIYMTVDAYVMTNYIQMSALALVSTKIIEWLWHVNVKCTLPELWWQLNLHNHTTTALLSNCQTTPVHQPN